MASELVRFNEYAKKYEVPPHAVSLLRSLPGPICVVSVCGRARQGKSFLLNQLLSLLDGPAAGAAAAASSRFAVGSTVKPCTKGLWLWTRPVPRTLSNGQACHLLLVDAEGIDSYDQTADYSNHIFSLALLLSSVMVYNQMGSIDESSVDKLSSVCEFARLIWGRAGNSIGGSASSAASSPDPATLSRDLSPAFVWLLRDFQLRLEEGGKQVSARDYMEEVLRELPGSSDAILAKNQLRASIKACFRERDCLALVRPLHDEAKLARMDSLPASELRPEFRKGLDVLVELLVSRACRPKALRGRPLSGAALAGLAEAYCRVINSGGVPAIASTWQSVVQSECRRALEVATDLYRARMEGARSTEVGLEALEATHKAALGAALEAFSQQAMGEVAEQEPFLRRLREAAESLVGPLRLTKRAQADTRAVELLRAQARKFAESIRGEGSDLAAAETRLHDFLREYGKEDGLGPDKFMRAAEFLAGSVVPELRRALQDARTRAAAAGARVSELETRVAQLTRGPAELRSSVGAESVADVQLRGELAAARSAEAAALAEVASARAAAAAAGRETSALREQLAAARLELAGRSESVDPDTARLRSELEVVQAQRRAAEAEAQSAAVARATAQQQLAAREAELAARAIEADGARRAAQAAQAAEAQARRHTEALSAQLSALKTTLANLERERDFLQTSLDLGRAQQQQPAQEATPSAARVASRRVRARASTAAAAAMQATPSAGRRKRDRAAAEFDEELGLEEMDAEMVDAVTTAGGAGAVAEDDGDVVEMQEVLATAGARGRRTQPVAAPAAAAAEQRLPRRCRTGGLTPTATTTPDATAARTGGGGGGNQGERTPWSEEREVSLRSTRNPVSRVTAAAATPPTGGAVPAAAAAAAARGPTVDDGGAGGLSGGGRTPWSEEREVVLMSTRSGTLGVGGASARHPAAQAAAAVATTAATPPAVTPPAPPAAAAAATAAAGRAAAAAAPVAAASAGPSAGASPRPPLPPNLHSMKVTELKDWLTTHGWAEEVYSGSRAKYGRKDWTEMVRSKCTGGPAPSLLPSPPGPSVSPGQPRR